MIDMNATMVAQIINFLLLVAILTKIAYRPILQALEERRTRIEKSLQEAEQERALAAAMKKESQEQVTAARIQARSIIDEAIALGEKSRESIIQKAEADNERLTKEAQAEIQRNYQQALSSLQTEVVILAVAAAEKIIEKNLDPETNARLVRGFIKDFTKKKYGELA
ncbi:ATP synthase subunit b, sodium ion specific [Sporomusa acidovorans DSM 3132]|uniref:ATP synthase subunit b n=2 Tax=Sporomusa TaxID=2375 RepID=A0ABZ3J9A6_SPOA4|nr:ATP synthase subunit b, sodium ion specific [Sporomusa acidovorans DSM 3132]SDD87928.1 F-type H+-transporting ATPase subunit b [Sporomusa acidovorans]